jgi:hypothetical protein
MTSERPEEVAPGALTWLTTFGPLATKVLEQGPDGWLRVAEGYNLAEHFRVTTALVHGLTELLSRLDQLATGPRRFVVRGELLPDADPQRCKRLLHPKRDEDGTISPATFRPAARRWLALDFDSLEPPEPLAGPRWLEQPCLTAAFLASLLPGEFRGVSCVLQATASAGVKPGIRARLWYWLDRPVSDAEAARWLANAPVDRSLFRTVQPIYTASPVFRGCRDPLPRRLWLVPGERGAVHVPELPAPLPRPAMVIGRPAPREGSAYASVALARECDAVAAAKAGGRHAGLNRAAFSLARFIVSRELGAAEVVSGLLWAARRAGLQDPDVELRRFLRCGLRAGAERAGAG